MRDAEEVAREAFQPPMDDPDRPDPAGPLSGSEWYAYALRHAERVIRARDAEVRAATLAEFEVETDDDCFCAVACESYTIHVRLVGPWEPEP